MNNHQSKWMLRKHTRSLSPQPKPIRIRESVASRIWFCQISPLHGLSQHDELSCQPSLLPLSNPSFSSFFFSFPRNCTLATPSPSISVTNLFLYFHLISYLLLFLFLFVCNLFLYFDPSVLPFHFYLAVTMSRGGTTLYVTGFGHGTRARELAYEFERYVPFAEALLNLPFRRPATRRLLPLSYSLFSPSSS